MRFLLHRPNFVEDTITSSEIEVEKRKKVISLIIGANPELLNVKDSSDRTPLLLLNIHPGLIKHLIKLGAHLEATDEDGNCLLHLAPRYLTPDQLHDLVCFIIQHCGRDRTQALYEMVNDEHGTPLHHQIATMKAETLELVVSSLEIDLDTQEDKHFAFLERAIKANRNSEFLNVLVNLGANYEYGEDSWSVVHIAAWFTNLEAIVYFTGKGCDVNQRGPSGNYQTPLILALFNDAEFINLQIVSRLVESGADVNVFHEKGNTSLLNSVISNSNNDPNIVAIIQLLIDNGADLRSVDRDYTEFHFMTYAGMCLKREQYHKVLRHLELTRHEQVFELLDGDVRQCCSPLSWAVHFMEVLPETLEVYQRQKVSFNKRDLNGSTPLISATNARRSVEFIEMLITRFSCDWRITDNRGWSALHHAAHRGHIEALCFLNGLPGCDINSKTANGETPLQIFVEQGDKDKLGELFPKIVALGADFFSVTSLYDIYIGDYNIKEMFAREIAEGDSIFEAVESNNLDSVIRACEVYSRKGKRPSEFWRKYKNQDGIFQAHRTRKYIPQCFVSPLHIAVKIGQREIVQYFLKDDRFDIKVADDPAFSNIMWFAVHKTSHVTAEQIENRKYIVNVLNDWNKDLVFKTRDKFLKFMDIHIELFIQLLELGMDLIKVNEETQSETNLLCSAALSFNREEYGLLVKNMARLGQLKFFNPQYIGSTRHQNPLLTAMQQGKLDEEALQMLWESEEINFNAVNDDGDSLLFAALRSFKYKAEFINVLVTRFGMNWKHRNYKLESVLHLAVKRGIENVQYFLNLGCPVNVKDINRSTPLHEAVSWRSLDIINLLIENGTDVNAKDKNGNISLRINRDTPLKRISYYSNGPTRYEPQRMSSFNRLHWIRGLIKYGANLCCQNLEGETILHSIINYHQQVFHRLCLNLVEMGYASCFTILDNKGRTALHHAVSYNRPPLQETIELFIHHGVNINGKDHLNGNTIFHSAVEASLPVEFLQKLKLCGVDIHARNNFGRNALHLAILKKSHYPDKHSEIVSYLVNEGCRLSVKDKIGNTPLHYAFQLAKTQNPSNDRILKVLLQKLSSELPLDEAIVVPFVDPFAINRRGQTAFQI